ncbi:MAG: YggS family pyridoxal phosphate-dependent enzyme [Nanoarchaeota archaeon]
MSIKDNVKKLWQEINSISSDKDKKIKLIAVTKKASINEINEVIDAGVDIIAENRVQNAAEKFSRIKNVEKHMIGHLQRNKVKPAVELFDVIQSVDSLRLAKEINKRAGDAGKLMKVMLQVNVSDEEQKFGLREDEVKSVYSEVLGMVNLKVIGIMVMAPFIEAEEARPFFTRAKKIKNELNLPELSAGMSNDYRVAIEEGSTMIRLGRKIFGS